MNAQPSLISELHVVFGEHWTSGKPLIEPMVRYMMSLGHSELTNV